MMMIDKICPGFIDEAQGFADEVNTEPEKILCYANSFHTAPNCCQFAVPSYIGYFGGWHLF
ncbi:hypothetical protein ABEX25_00515 [Paenibacillus thiaminolyticus]|uniref:hypothetical protein n=1 Tax=Paenibacillus thiaminolyticus TaxID=49283 RepID=UPI003D2D066E